MPNFHLNQFKNVTGQGIIMKKLLKLLFGLFVVFTFCLSSLACVTLISGTEAMGETSHSRKVPGDYADNNVYYLCNPTRTSTVHFLKGVPLISDGSDPELNQLDMENGRPYYYVWPMTGLRKARLEYNQSFDGNPYINIVLNSYDRHDKVVNVEIGIDTDNDDNFEVVCTFPPYHTIGNNLDGTMEEEYFEAYGEWQGGKPPAFMEGKVKLKITMTSPNGDPCLLYCGFDYKVSWCALPYMHTDLLPRARINKTFLNQGFDPEHPITVGDKVWFDARDSFDPNDDTNGNEKIDAGEIDRLRYEWNFGDGYSSDRDYGNRNVSHIYTSDSIPITELYRIFEVNLTVWDDENHNDWNATRIKVYRGTHSPIISSLKVNNYEQIKSKTNPSPITIKSPLDQSVKVYFSAAASDQDGDDLKYHWDFDGDDTEYEIEGDETVASSVFYSFSEPNFHLGLNQIKLMVSDGTPVANATASCNVSFVENKNPEATIRARRDLDPIDTYFSTNLTVRPNQIIYFDASQSVDPDNLPGFDINDDHKPDFQLKYRWRFNIYDPTATSGWITDPVYAYSYLSAGKDNRYTVLLDVDDGLSVSTSENFTIYVNVRPVAKIFIDPKSYTDQGNFELGRPIYFNGSASSDPNGDKITNYTWDFGDGNKSYKKQPVYTYWTPSEYTVSLIVSDYEFSSIVDQIPIEIPNPPKPPIIRYKIYPLQTYTHREVIFDASKTTDPDSASKDLKFVWYFGDNTTSTEKNTTHRYLKAGEYLVTLEVTDEAGTKASKSEIVVHVLNRKPVALIRPLKNVPANEDVRVSGVDSRDDDGTVTRYLWDFGDGSSLDWTNESTVQHKWKHPGKYTITLTVEDDLGYTNETQLEIRVVEPEEDAGGLFGSAETTNTVMAGAIITLIIIIVVIFVIIMIKRSQESI